MLTAVHRSNFNVPKFILKQYTNQCQCTMKGKLCTQTLELINHILLPLCTHTFFTKSDELISVHAGVIWFVNLGACEHKVIFQCTLPIRAAHQGTYENSWCTTPTFLVSEGKTVAAFTIMNKFGPNFEKNMKLTQNMVYRSCLWDCTVYFYNKAIHQG